MSPFVSAHRGYRLGAGSLERLRLPPKKTPFFTRGRAGFGVDRDAGHELVRKVKKEWRCFRGKRIVSAATAMR